MAYSSILGAETAPQQPSGRDSELLGPSDNSDSGSDTVGTHEQHADSDAAGTGEIGSADGRDTREGADIMPDRVVNLSEGEVLSEEPLEGMDLTDLDADADIDTDVEA